MEKIATNLLPDFLPDFDLVQYVQTSRRCKKLIYDAFSRQFKEQCQGNCTKNIDKRVTRFCRDCFPPDPHLDYCDCDIFCGEAIDKRYTLFCRGYYLGVCRSCLRPIDKRWNMRRLCKRCED
jgi:hypothetical protein